MDCPCQSGLAYAQCCRPFHQRSMLPQTPEALMRSRYSAFALAKVPYIMATTHHENVGFESNASAWSAELRNYCRQTQFLGLTIHQASNRLPNWRGDEIEGIVEFSANLYMNGSQDIELKEKSLFKKPQDRWLYFSGEAQWIPQS